MDDIYCHDTWNASLQNTKFSIVDKDNRAIVTSADLSNALGLADSFLVVHVEARLGFSKWDYSHALQCSFVSDLTEMDSKFGVSSLSAPSIDAEVSLVFDEIVRRVRTVSQISPSECSMREFISPILIGALNVLKKDITFCCEKSIYGRLGYGPVDYDFIYNHFHICVAEAKKEAVDLGIAQNIAQMIAAREEFESKYILDKKKRKRTDEPSVESRCLRSMGIVSTGTEWIFLQYLFDGSKWILCRSNAVKYALVTDSQPARDALREGISRALVKILYILESQIEAVDAFRETKRSKEGEN